MTLVNSYDEISELIEKQFCRSMVCNSAPSGDMLRAEIEEQLLYYHLWDGGLCIIRRRKTHDILTFYIKDMTVPFDFDTDRDTVVEILQKPKTDATPIIEYWKRLGFCEILQRLRLTKPKSEEKPGLGSVSFAKIGDKEKIAKLFSCNFNILTGCLPTDTALEKSIKNSEMICEYSNAGLVGALHFTESKLHAEIRHLCVDEHARRKGAATKLTNNFFAATQGKKAVVWTGSENKGAISFYKSCGFEPDNYKSFILLYKKGQ